MVSLLRVAVGNSSDFQGSAVWANEIGISKEALRKRLKTWPLDRALSKAKYGFYKPRTKALEQQIQMLRAA